MTNGNGELSTPPSSLNQFVHSLSTAWKGGEVRPTHRKSASAPRPWRTRADPFEWELVEQWLGEQPGANPKDLLDRLQQTDPTIPDNQLRTLQRRVGRKRGNLNSWRSKEA